MRNRLLKNKITRTRRSRRVRQNIHGTSSRPRLSVNKTNKHIQAQLIDDDAAITIAGVATYSKEFRNTEFGKKNKAAARKIGESIAQMAKDKNIKEVIFDRGCFKYHGVLAELADAARASGLKF